MILSLDNLAHRYGILPSEAMQRGSTFDLYVLDVSSRYVKYQQDLAKGRVQAPQTLSQDQMAEMLLKAKERKKKR